MCGSGFHYLNYIISSAHPITVLLIQITAAILHIQVRYIVIAAVSVYSVYITSAILHIQFTVHQQSYIFSLQYISSPTYLVNSTSTSPVLYFKFTVHQQFYIFSSTYSVYSTSTISTSPVLHIQLTVPVHQQSCIFSLQYISSPAYSVYSTSAVLNIQFTVLHQFYTFIYISGSTYAYLS